MFLKSPILVIWFFSRLTCEFNFNFETSFVLCPDAPFVEPRFQSLEVDYGQDQVAHLECRFYGFPDTVRWQRVNGDPIETSHANGSRYTTATYVIEDESIVAAQLSVNQVTEEDFDWYACEGSNVYASVNGYVMLTGKSLL